MKFDWKRPIAPILLVVGYLFAFLVTQLLD